MDIDFLRTNPFYILNVNPDDNRRTIIEKAEEKSFFTEDESCEQARACLLNPSKRLSAEVNWFYNVPKETLENICKSIEENKKIEEQNLYGISKLNQVLYNFSISEIDDYYDLGHIILNIDYQTRLNIPDLIRSINESREIAGIVPAAESDIERELNSKRSQIRQIINEKTKKLSQGDYIEMVKMLSLWGLTDREHADAPIIMDVIDQYELTMQTIIENAADDIISSIEKIKVQYSASNIDCEVTNLVALVRKWYRLVQPLHQRSFVTGLPCEISKKVSKAIGEFTIWLHNKKGKTTAAIHLMEETVKYFAEIKDVSDSMNTAISVLKQNQINQDRAQEILGGMTKISEDIEQWKKDKRVTEEQTDSLMREIRGVNGCIKSLPEDKNEQKKLRITLCALGRTAAIFLHNELQKTEMALSLAKVLQLEFYDIAELNGKLQEDVVALTAQCEAIKKSSKKTTYRPLFISLLIVVLLCWAVFKCESGDYVTSSASADQKVNRGPIVEHYFTDYMEEGEYAYADIVFIYPSYMFQQDGADYYDSYLCECTAPSGENFWLYISSYDYKYYFEPGVSSKIDSFVSEGVSCSSRRIYGTATKANTLSPGLSEDINAENVLVYAPEAEK